MMHVALIGSGKIGEAIVTLFQSVGGYKLTVVDKDAERLAPMKALGATVVMADVANDDLTEKLKGVDVVISACPFYLTAKLAKLARNLNAHYFDLTEDVESTKVVKEIAKGASTVFMPQCGLAPGFISVVANELTQKFETLRDVNMRVGALPVYPTNALKYNLTWSTDGLINEYCNPCEAIVDGHLREMPALEETEHFSLDGIDYEAFNTSGGLGTLCETLEGRVENLNYKTVRYPGHRDIIKTLVRDLRLGQRRDILKDVLEKAIPITYQDVVLVFVTVSGEQHGTLTQESYAKKVYAHEIEGKLMSAIQITTAAGICAMVDMMVAGKLPKKGFVRQEQAELKDFLANRFGRVYA